MKASELILDSYYKAGILDPEEEVDGYYLRTGLTLLNDIIADWSSIGAFIIFEKRIEFPLVYGQSSYVVSKLPGADVDEHPITNFVAGHVTLASVKQPLIQVFTKVDNVQNYDLVSGLPANIYLVDKEAQTELWFYPTPVAGMTAHLTVKMRYGEVGAFEDIIEIVPRARRAFKYELAKELAIEFKRGLDDDFREKYEEVMSDFITANIKDSPVNRGRELQRWGVYGTYLPGYWGP